MTASAAYSNPYTADSDIEPIELLPYTAEDYDIRTVLKYTEFLHLQRLIQPARTAANEPLHVRYGVVRAHDNQHIAHSADSTSTLPRRVVQVVDDSTLPLPPELIDVLEYVGLLAGLDEARLSQQKFKCEVKQVAAPPATNGGSANARAAKRRKANESLASAPIAPTADAVPDTPATKDASTTESSRPAAKPTAAADASSS